MAGKLGAKNGGKTEGEEWRERVSGKTEREKSAGTQNCLRAGTQPDGQRKKNTSACCRLKYMQLRPTGDRRGLFGLVMAEVLSSAQGKRFSANSRPKTHLPPMGGRWGNIFDFFELGHIFFEFVK